MRAFTSNSDRIGISHTDGFEAVSGAYRLIINNLRANGWKVRKYKKSDRGYISGHWAFAYNGHLKIRITKDCDKKHNFSWNYGFDFDLFEDVSPCDNSNGGVYKSHRFNEMPYLLKLLSIKTVKLIKQCLIDCGFEFPDEYSYVGFPKKKLATDVIKARNNSARAHIKPGMDRAEYSPWTKRSSQDGELLEHKKTAYMRYNGRLIRGTIYYDNGNWIFVYGEYGAYFNVQPGEIIVNPEVKKGRFFSERTANGRLQSALSRALKHTDYLRAHQLKQIIMKEKMFRIWSAKHGGGWWCINGPGYTTNINCAGLFKIGEAERLCRKDNELTMQETA
ncbi:hypothetical protein TUM4261_33100 [Shewanella sp. c952]|uniref:hypothetical protein n=1 Tax=Shewanella sp. c952 TaxID=2815913 RepID=UPI001BC4AC31|nr:hypothetical protein [Shewanella sp. c952]GIU15694.1 hypothetical protein TUM4261_33100 [Shewanella sp. c952]